VSESKVQYAADVAPIITRAQKLRSTQATNLNTVSSRSHAIVTVRVITLLKNGDVRQNKLCLVDLAGAERVKDSQVENQRLDETKSISRSLTALRTVITALNSKQSTAHIPYRNDTLTFLLQDALGGNSKTVFVACAPMTSVGWQDTLRVLQFASQARLVRTKPQQKHIAGSVFLQQSLSSMQGHVQELERKVQDTMAVIDSLLGSGLPLTSVQYQLLRQRAIESLSRTRAMERQLQMDEAEFDDLINMQLEVCRSALVKARNRLHGLESPRAHPEPAGAAGGYAGMSAGNAPIHDQDDGDENVLGGDLDQDALRQQIEQLQKQIEELTTMQRMKEDGHRLQRIISTQNNIANKLTEALEQRDDAVRFLSACRADSMIHTRS